MHGVENSQFSVTPSTPCSRLRGNLAYMEKRAFVTTSKVEIGVRRGRPQHPDAVKMEISWVSLVGSAAGVCTTVAYLPQVIRTWRTRSTADISLGMFSVMVLGVIFWLIYGIALNDWPIIGANSVTLVLTGTILVLKLRHG